jgi:hypothetical protein
MEEVMVKIKEQEEKTKGKPEEEKKEETNDKDNNIEEENPVEPENNNLENKKNTVKLTKSFAFVLDGEEWKIEIDKNGKVYLNGEKMNIKEILMEKASVC